MRDITEVDKQVRRNPPAGLLACRSDCRRDSHHTHATERTQVYSIKYQDHLLYHYLGGTILALLGDYPRAAELLEIVRRLPTFPLSCRAPPLHS